MLLCGGGSAVTNKPLELTAAAALVKIKSEKAITSVLQQSGLRFRFK